MRARGPGGHYTAQRAEQGRQARGGDEGGGGEAARARGGDGAGPRVTCFPSTIVLTQVVQILTPEALAAPGRGVEGTSAGARGGGGGRGGHKDFVEANKVEVGRGREGGGQRDVEEVVTEYEVEIASQRQVKKKNLLPLCKSVCVI